jgi:hypothetical protein
VGRNVFGTGVDLCVCLFLEAHQVTLSGTLFQQMTTKTPPLLSKGMEQPKRNMTVYILGPHSESKLNKEYSDVITACLLFALSGPLPGR